MRSMEGLVVVGRDPLFRFPFLLPVSPNHTSLDFPPSVLPLTNVLNINCHSSSCPPSLDPSSRNPRARSAQRSLRSQQLLTS
jgi:hypothetical protein